MGREKIGGGGDKLAAKRGRSSKVYRGRLGEERWFSGGVGVGRDRSITFMPGIRRLF